LSRMSNQNVENDPEFKEPVSTKVTRPLRKRTQAKLWAPQPTKPNKKWYNAEKSAFLKALRKYGSKDTKSLSSEIGTKDVDAVQRFVKRLMRKSLDLPEPAPPVPRLDLYRNINKTSKDPKLSIYDSDVTLLKLWISKMEQNRPDQSRSVAKMMEFIAKHEAHPSPEECGGIDYAGIYQHLGDIFSGHAPKELNSESQAHISQMLSAMSHSLGNLDLSEKKLHLQTYRSKPTRSYRSKATATKQTAPVEGSSEDNLLTAPGINPLQLQERLLEDEELLRIVNETSHKEPVTALNIL